MKIAVVILAAGRGERMNSSIPKVLHKIEDRPMLQHVIDSAHRLGPTKIVVVVGEHYTEIKKSIKAKYVSFAIQSEPKGTADALSRARNFLRGFNGNILVLNGDVPLITPGTLRKFFSLHLKQKNDISIISFVAGNPSAYGRIARDSAGGLLAIVEEKDATQEQKKINEVNSGIYLIRSKMLSLLKNITLNKLKGEYYLTDIIGLAKQRNFAVEAYCIGSEDEMMGVNTVQELLRARQAFRARIMSGWIQKGVVLISPDTTFISEDAMIGKDTIIYPNVYLEGKTRIGKGCVIHPNVRIINSEIRDAAVIKDSTVIENSLVRSQAVVGPFAHLRPGCDIGTKAKIGNFVEVKKSVIGNGAKASHLSYLGDATIGKGVNIGAGTITCNYNGREKHKTTIEDNVFVGSDTQFIAPVTVGKGAYIGAGSTITKNVPPLSLAVSRAEQKNIEGWAKKRTEVRNQKSKVKRRKGI